MPNHNRQFMGEDGRRAARGARSVVALPRRDAAGAADAGVDVVPQVREALDIMTETCGENLVAVLFFGSVLVGTSPTQDSAADLFVVVDDYRRFYRDVGYRLPAARSTAVMTGLNKVLPPNIIYLRNPGDLRAGAKCFIISREAFADSLSAESRDHFCRGRLVQRVQVVYARSAEIAEEVEKDLENARRVALDWVPLYLPRTFDTLEFCRRMLEVSYRSEIRPESRARVGEVFEAQKTYFLLMFGRLLEDGVAEGKLERVDGRYRLARRPPLSSILQWRLFFVRSKVRATLRWGKYMLTFDDWLDYIARKAERRTGVRLDLTKAERRLPALLLWPKLIRVLRAMRNRDQGDASRSRS